MIRSMNIAWWVQRWSEFVPEKNAFIFKNKTTSYLELHRMVNRTASWLQSLGIEKGDRVAIMSKNRPEFIELYLACACIGVIFVPINFRLTGPELEYILNDSQPNYFIFESEYAEMIKKLNWSGSSSSVLLACMGECQSSADILDYTKETMGFDGQKPNPANGLGPVDPEEAQVIMYTSGTTGRPKGAVLSHRKTFFNCLNTEMFFRMDHNDIVLIVLPLFHSGGLFIQASPSIYMGSTMIISPKVEPAEIYEDIEKYKVTKFLSVPTVYKGLIKVPLEERKSLSSLKICAIGGEKSTIDLIDECKKKFFPLRQISGQTETSILLWSSEEDLKRKPGTLGRPVFHAEVELMDKQGKPVLPRQPGEIVVRGSIMMNGYWQDPKKTKETIKDGWLHTGDLAYRDEDGYFFMLDRELDMYISGGENVYPAEIERILRGHPEIEEAAVIGVPDETWGQTGYSFVIRHIDSKLAEMDLLRYFDGKLARYKWPKKITFCNELPLTALGKIRKPVLRSWFQSNKKEVQDLSFVEKIENNT